MDSVSVAQKRCRKCQEVKSLDEFGPDTRSSDGKVSRCRVCQRTDGRAYMRARRARAPETLREISRRYYQRNHEKALQTAKNYREQNREAIIAYSREYRKQNPDKARASKRKWEAANIEKVRHTNRIASKKYRAANVEKVRLAVCLSQKKHADRKRTQTRNRFAQKKQAQGSHTAQEFAAKLELYEGRCHWCGEVITGPIHADHVIPLARGGSNDISNLVPACAPCNLNLLARAVPHLGVSQVGVSGLPDRAKIRVA